MLRSELGYDGGVGGGGTSGTGARSLPPPPPHRKNTLPDAVISVGSHWAEPVQVVTMAQVNTFVLDFREREREREREKEKEEERVLLVYYVPFLLFSRCTELTPLCQPMLSKFLPWRPSEERPFQRLLLKSHEEKEK